MKVIPLSEAKARLGRYARLCQEEPVVVTVNGVPTFQLAPLTDDGDLIDRLIESNPEFRALLEGRLREGTVSAAEAARRV